MSSVNISAFNAYISSLLIQNNYSAASSLIPISANLSIGNTENPYENLYLGSADNSGYLSVDGDANLTGNVSTARFPITRLSPPSVYHQGNVTLDLSVINDGFVYCDITANTILTLDGDSVDSFTPEVGSTYQITLIPSQMTDPLQYITLITGNNISWASMGSQYSFPTRTTVYLHCDELVPNEGNAYFTYTLI
jgi:hypothetical protein